MALTWLALLALLWVAIHVPAAETVAGPRFYPSLQAARDAAATDQSILLIVFGADWCPPCKRFKSVTLSSQEFLEQGGPLSIAEVDADAEAATAHRYEVTALPTLVVQTSDGKIVARSEGFLDTAELLLWLRQARDRVKEGKWEGTAPSSQLDVFLAKASADQLNTNDLERLIEMLGDPHQADRDAAGKLLLRQRELAMIPLLHALTNSYLGIRIAACEILQALTSQAQGIDPWLPPSDLAPAAASLGRWWAETGKLPPPQSELRFEDTNALSAREVLDSLQESDPVHTTEVMSRLVNLGLPALPAIREAIKTKEKAGDQSGVVLLEDVRWAILVPDEVDQRAGGVRTALARGRGPDRQSAALRLGKAGRIAIPALSELLGDSDPLVIESAMRALGGLGGKDAIPGMAALLKAADSNVRTAAAQALGHTKNPSALEALLQAFEDPNEVVVCASISAVAEIKGQSEYPSTKRSQSAELIQALKRALSDPRWRVRAAAADLSGALGSIELSGALDALLGDSDSFVVRSALEALEKIGATPSSEKLLLLAEQHPDLRSETVGLLVSSVKDDSVKTVTDLYRSSTVEGRTEIVRNLAANSSRNSATNPWQPLLSQAVVESDPRLRRAVAEILAAQPAKSASLLVTPLLTDEDEPTRAAAAAAILSILSGERQVVSSSHGSRISQFLDEEEIERAYGQSRNTKSNTNEPPASAEQIAAWHAALLRSGGQSTNLVVAVAVYVTGDSNACLPALQQAVQRAGQSDLGRLSRSAAIAALLPRLPWPAAQPVVERFCGNTQLFLKMISRIRNAPQGLQEYILRPDRFRAAVDPSSPEDLENDLGRLLSGDSTSWSLLSNQPSTEAILTALLGATNGVWRTAAVYSFGLERNTQREGIFKSALEDSNGWVRAAAVVGLIQTVKDRSTLEQLLGPLLDDSNRLVTRKAAIGLLEPETRVLAGLSYDTAYFEYERVHIWSPSFESSGELRPPETLSGNPAFLTIARQRLTNGSPEDISLSALLLAQYGDFTGLDQILKSIHTEQQSDVQGEMLATVALSKDPKYIPVLKMLVGSTKDSQDQRRVLQALRGMSGPEARQLRVEINKKIRESGDQ